MSQIILQLRSTLLGLPSSLGSWLSHQILHNLICGAVFNLSKERDYLSLSKLKKGFVKKAECFVNLWIGIFRLLGWNWMQRVSTEQAKSCANVKMHLFSNKQETGAGPKVLCFKIVHVLNSILRYFFWFSAEKLSKRCKPLLIIRVD